MRTLIIMFTFIIIASCSGQKKTYNFKLTKMKISKLNSEHKKIDLKSLNHYKDNLESSGKKELLISNNLKNSPKNYFYKSFDAYCLDEYDNKKEKIKETNIKFDNSVDIIEKVDDYFDYYESYYSNGRIKSKLISSWLGFGVGKSYKYDVEGNLIETKDWDEGYKFTFKDVLLFLNKIPIEINKPSPITIHKIIDNNIKTWVVTFPDMHIKKQVTYVLDAFDGSILNRYERDLPVFRHRNL